MKIGSDRFAAEWFPALAICVGEAHRLNGLEGTLPPAGRHRIRDAYLAAGGDPGRAATAPSQIIAVLCRMFPDWMHGPARRRVAEEEEEEEEMAMAARRGISLRS
jgi:hypothetical protein